jgi:hypothetical protein
MSYNNDYNIKIIDKLKQILLNSIENSKENGTYFDLFDMEPRYKLKGRGHEEIEHYKRENLNSIYYDMPVEGIYKTYATTNPSDKIGKGGFNKGTHLDTGYEKTKGATVSSVGSKKYKKKGGSKDIKLEKKKVERVIGGKRGRPSKMKGGTELGLPLSFFSSNNKEVIEVKKKKKKEEEDMKKKELELKKEEEKNNNQIEKDINIPGEAVQLDGKGKKKKGKGKLTERAQMKGVVYGGKKKNKESVKSKGESRAEIVKRIMKEKGLKMIMASKYVKEHGLYKKK